MRRISCLLFAAVLLAACSKSNGNDQRDAGIDAGTDAGRDAGRDAGADPGTDPGPTQGELPERPACSGVVYVGHFLSNDLRWYRVDGDHPVYEDSIDMGAYAHDLTLDPVNDLLFVANDVAREVTVYRLHRPAGPGSPVTPPALQATLTFPHAPRFLRADPYHQRLYVVQELPSQGGEPVLEYALHVYDTTDPTAPAAVSGSPFAIPTTTSLDIDAARQVLFLFHGPDDTLHGFDLHGDGPTPLPGEPLVLTDWYPEENNFSFQARNLTVDMETNRIYAARPQGNLSELIVIEYPEWVPAPGDRYGLHASMDDLVEIDDPFDLSLDMDSRPHILDAFTPLVDADGGQVFLVANTWNGNASSTLLVSMDAATLALGPGCDDFEGFGCFYRSYFDGSPGVYLQTDGATCVDPAHRVVAGTTYDTLNEENPGSVVFFRYDLSGGTQPWITAEGRNPTAGSLPIGAVCH